MASWVLEEPMLLTRYSLVIMVQDPFLLGGFYDAACANEVRQLKACARLHYEHRIREYYGRMLKKVLIYRRVS